MSALTEAQAARSELHLSDAWNLYHNVPTSHTYQCDQHIGNVIAALAPPPPPGHTLPVGGDLAAFIGDMQGTGAVGYLTSGVYPLVGSLKGKGQFTLKSLDLANRATIAGQIAAQPGADAMQFESVKLDGRHSNGSAASWAIGAKQVYFVDVEATNYGTHIGFNFIRDTTYGTATECKLLRSHVHDCGPTFKAYTDPGYFCHAAYIIGDDTEVADCILETSSNRGTQLRGSQNGHVHHNLIRNNGCGVIFGDLKASNNLVEWNAIIGNGAGVQNPNRLNAFGAFSWWGTAGVGTGNRLENNYFFGNHVDIHNAEGGFTEAGNVIGTSAAYPSQFGPRP
jgi:hypothetical protein